MLAFNRKESEITDEEIDRAKSICTQTDPEEEFSAEDQRMRRFACCLCAHYYSASYDYLEGRSPLLFSFPWVVCSDVIKAGLLKATREEEEWE